MKISFLAVLFAVTVPGLLLAQAPLASSTGGILVSTGSDIVPVQATQLPATAEQPMMVESGGRAYFMPVQESDTPATWATAEFLIWWVQGGPLGVPLVTTGNPADPIPGALGQPGTTVLFGSGRTDFGAQDGLRLSLGGWLNADNTIGVEVSGFVLEQRKNIFAVTSDAAGVPLLAVPFFDPTIPGESALSLLSGLPGGNQEGVTVTMSSQLWGAEVNGLYNVARSDRFHFELLAGFRHLELDEKLNLDAIAIVPGTSVFGPGVGGNQPFVASDRFSTRNQFYGGQLGAKTGLRSGRLFADFTGKLGFGGMHEVLLVNGSSIDTLPLILPFFGVFNGGVFTQNTNIGNNASSRFALIPEIQIQSGIDVTSRLRAFVGYNFLYVSDVVRPGSQIDRVVNPSQVGGFPLVGPAQPAPVFRHTDFWAQGISFGAELRY